VDGFPLAVEVEPRFRDTDAMGHVNNAVYITYFEVVRAEYWFRLTGLREYQQVPFILAHVTADFRSSALIGEKLEVGMRITRLGEKSFDAEYRIETAGGERLIAEGRSVMVMYDYDAERSYPIPEELREQVRVLEKRPDL
jgi:acyl-CoA thioester hydrolase